MRYRSLIELAVLKAVGFRAKATLYGLLDLVLPDQYSYQTLCYGIPLMSSHITAAQSTKVSSVQVFLDPAFTASTAPSKWKVSH